MSTAVYHQRKTCRLCDSANINTVVPFEATPVGDFYITQEHKNSFQEEFPLSLALCEECGAAQILDIVDPKILYGNFKYETSVSLGLPEHFQQYAKEICDFVMPSAGGVVIDIGSNDGTLLKCFQTLGMNVLGIDPAPEASRKANEAGIETLNDYFSGELVQKIIERYGKAAIITANNTIANIDDLSSFVLSIRSLMDETSCFVFETGYIVDLVKDKLVDVVYHEHLSYFSIESLDLFFKRFDMQIIDAKHIPTKGGSIRCIVQLKDGKKNVCSSVEEMISEEDDAGVDKVSYYDELHIFMESNKKELVKMIKEFKKQGKTIAGYGASVGVTTLLYYYGLGNFIDILFDDNPIKKGLFSPGQHIPVVASEEIYERKPDYILVFSWRYINAIQKRHAKFLKQGGHFIVPLPKLKVI